MKRYLRVLACLMAASVSAEGFDQAHGDWEAVLSAHVESGLVDYPAIAGDQQFASYLGALSGVTEAEFRAWTKSQQMAYWINAYNAYTIKAILDHYPIKRRGLLGRFYPENSIRQIPGVWDELKFRAGGRLLTLNQIEHDVLRPGFRDARIHVAVVCASIGCPVLADYAYRGDRLEEQLERKAEAFGRNPLQVRVDLGKKKLYLSKILDWYGEDFSDYEEVEGYGKLNGVVSFVAKYASPVDARIIRSTRLKVEWINYDWRLNEQK